MRCEDTFTFEWDFVLQSMPELEDSALALKALRRRRDVRSAADLLRLALVYGYCDFSLRETAAWAASVGLADVSDVALLKRFRQCPDWLGHLLSAKIAERAQWRPPSCRGWRVKLFDGSGVKPPGAGSSYWRIHLGFDLQRMTIDQVEITDSKGGESLQRFNLAEGDLAVADRGFAHRAGMLAVAESGAGFLVRLPWNNVPLQQRDGQPWELFTFLRALPDATCGEAEVRFQSGGRTLACRVLALRKTEAAAEQSREKVLRAYRSKSKQIDPRTLEAAGYTILLTNVEPSELSAEAGLELYRYRWQVELAFKRLKSLTDLDQLRAKEPAMVKTYLLAKLLGVLVLEDLQQRYLAFFPWGFPFQRPSAPVHVACAASTS